jgi:hypothetical protein
VLCGLQGGLRRCSRATLDVDADTDQGAAAAIWRGVMLRRRPLLSCCGR